MLDAKFTVVGGDAKKKDIRFQEPMLVGRGADCTVPIRHKLVSRRHCEIFEHKGYLYVRDLNSLNGTFVDSERIVDKKMLKPNQLLTIGNVTLRAVYEPGKQCLDGNMQRKEISAVPAGDAGSTIGDVTVYNPQATKSAGNQQGDGLSNDHHEHLLPTPNSQHPPTAPKRSGAVSASLAAGRAAVKGNHQSLARAANGDSRSHDIFDELPNGDQTPSTTNPSLIEDSSIVPAQSLPVAGSKSISVSKLANLEGNDGGSNRAPISSVDIHEEAHAKRRQVTASSLAGADFFEEDGKSDAEEKDDSRLGSFIRKLPR